MEHYEHFLVGVKIFDIIVYFRISCSLSGTGVLQNTFSLAVEPDWEISVKHNIIS